MSCVAQQRDIAINPCRNGFTVDHGIFKYFGRAAQHAGNVYPIVVPLFKMMHELFMPYLSVPVAIAPAAGIIHRNLCNPVDVRKAGESIRC